MRKLSPRSLVKELNTLCNELDSEYDINLGGCCFVASEIAKHLDKLNLKYELRIFDYYDKKNKESINNEVKFKRKHNTPETSVVGHHCCTHYFIHVKGYGSVNAFKNYFKKATVYKITDITYKNIKWIYNISSWNNYYRKSNNSKIKKLITSCFEPYKQTI